MKIEDIAAIARKFAAPYRVTAGKRFRLENFDPGDTGSLQREDKPRAKEALQRGIDAMRELQDKLYAQNRWGVLLIFQAMDAAGKDGAIKHVMSGVNPQGCQVAAFKAPSNEDLDHDFLWRCNKQLPERGRIGIFNRSYYEEVLVVRVHEDLLARQRLPATRLSRNVWKERFEDIRAYERYLDRNGILVRKIFLNVSRAEQKKRFLERIDLPEKNWKFESADVRERGLWKEYMAAYEEAIRATATPESPWFVVPADNKWFTRVAVAAVVIDALASLDLRYPEVDDAKRKELAAVRRMLMAEKK